MRNQVYRFECNALVPYRRVVHRVSKYWRLIIDEDVKETLDYLYIRCPELHL